LKTDATPTELPPALQLDGMNIHLGELALGQKEVEFYKCAAKTINLIKHICKVLYEMLCRI